ncbi:LysR family transcriptional regulator [Paractinoplanes atraurantiacus]|uniref:DNA-binding transcriptional regulator, LysR family n=1 Tax=Paractinoplanes atraurantiacus TaxID=1036182 RepID=A0A285IQ15_9ACTN|nr:LysR family transcriptional regulator [Actinoplanes atraurantiacus]SNY50088.1 DNA-binding transcriptional regulator, LysR family [Actinoplanes atraurantiacus]
MDLSRHLRYFLVVAEELHFGRAAELLGIAQPPLSQSIQRLERELGVELFDRSRRQVGLTAAGRLLRDEARALLAAEGRLRGLMRSVRDGRLGTLRAGVPPETPAPVLQALLQHVDRRLAGLDVDLRELTTAEQVRLLGEGHLDVGLVHHPVDAPGLRFGPTAGVRLGVVLPRGSPLAATGELALAALAGNDLILPPRAAAPGWHDHVLEVCRRHGFSPRTIRPARNPGFLLGLVLAGQGVAFEPEDAVRREPRVAWRPIAGHPLRRTITAAWPAPSPHPAAERFAQIAAETLDDAAPVPMAVPAADAARPWSVVFGQ